MVQIPLPPNYHPEEALPPPLVMNERERALRDAFVCEYLVDYSAVKACMRIGFPREFAEEWAKKLLDEAYVQQRMNAVALSKPPDPKTALEYDQIRIRSQLMREAHYYGPGSSHAARVSALKQLAELSGMEPPKKVEATVKHQGGVMRVPGAVDSVEAWEQSALASQEALARDAGS